MEEMNYQAFWKFIKLLHDNDLLEHVIVIGSWCEYIYAQGGVLPDYSAMIRTLDIDFLVKNMRKPYKERTQDCRRFLCKQLKLYMTSSTNAGISKHPSSHPYLTIIQLIGILSIDSIPKRGGGLILSSVLFLNRKMSRNFLNNLLQF